MPNSSGEIRYDRPDMVMDSARVARTLDRHGIVAFRYAAFGTLHCFIAMDSNRLLGAPNAAQPGAPQDQLWIGPYAPPGIGEPERNSHTLWVRQNSNTGRSAWLNRAGYHDPLYLSEKFDEKANPTDALGLGVLFLLIETRRGLVYDIVPTIEKWTETLEGEKELPAFMTQIPDPERVAQGGEEGREL